MTMKSILSKLLLLTLMSTMLASCAFMDRRDFEDEMSSFRMDDPMFIPNEQFAVVPGDTGRYYRSTDTIASRTPATARTLEERQYNESLIRELYSLENKVSDNEYSKYLKIKSKLGSISEQIYYLRLDSMSKESYLESRGITATKSYSMAERSIAGYTQPIQLGMQKADVMQVWGRPIRTDYNGDPRYENERWEYRRNGAVSYVYFSQGRVDGWNAQ